MILTAPQPLHADHRLADFRCGAESLDRWLNQRALRNQASGATRTFVVCGDTGDGERVVAYYALASGAVAAELATGRMRRNMPDPIPVVLLARLAVDRSCQGRGFARALLRDAAIRVVAAADAIGIRGLLVHALDDAAKAFYRHIGFEESPLEPMTLMTSLADLRAGLEPT